MNMWLLSSQTGLFIQMDKPYKTLSTIVSEGSFVEGIQGHFVKVLSIDMAPETHPSHFLQYTCLVNSKKGGNNQRTEIQVMR